MSFVLMSSNLTYNADFLMDYLDSAWEWVTVRFNTAEKGESASGPGVGSRVLKDPSVGESGKNLSTSCKPIFSNVLCFFPVTLGRHVRFFAAGHAAVEMRC